MRHRKHTAKLGRTSEHRNLMLSNLVCSLIKHRRVTTTLAKAKAARPVAEKMVTLGKSGTIHDRRLAASRLHQEDAVRILFNQIAPTQKDRHGGYTRIIKLNQRQGDAAQLAILEWVDEALLDTSAEDTGATTAASSGALKSGKSEGSEPASDSGESKSMAASNPEGAAEKSEDDSAKK